MRGLRLGLGLNGRGGGAPAVPDFYVDSVNGSDSNDGLTAETAFATMSRLDTELASDPSINVAFARGSRLAPLTLGFDRPVSGTWQAYGTGDMPFIDCSLPVTVGDIAPHGTHANVYVVEITHATAPFYTTNVNSNGPHVGLWWETAATGMLGQYLVPTFGLADTATAEAFVRDNPGTVFVQKVGSSLTDVRLETTGSTLRYTFQLADSSDPRSGGTLRYANYHATGIRFDPGADIRGIAFGRNTRKDCTAANNDITTLVALPLFTECAWLDPGCHAIVGPTAWKKCIAYSRTLGSISGGGGAHHSYSGAASVDPRTPDVEDTFIRGFANAVYAHGSGQSPVLNSMTGRRLKIEDCRAAFSTTTTTETCLFTDVLMEDVGSIMGGNATVSRFVFKGFPWSSGRFNVFGFGSGTVEDGVMIKGSGGGSFRPIDYVPSSDAAADAIGTAVFRRVTSDGSVERVQTSTGVLDHLLLTIEDTIFGATVFDNVTTNQTNQPLRATISNSYVGPIKNGLLPLYASLADWQAYAPGVANDVVMYDGNKLPTFSGDPTANPTLTGPAEILGLGMGVDPAIITALPTTLASVPTLASMGLTP